MNFRYLTVRARVECGDEIFLIENSRLSLVQRTISRVMERIVVRDDSSKSIYVRSRPTASLMPRLRSDRTRNRALRFSLSSRFRNVFSIITFIYANRFIASFLLPRTAGPRTARLHVYLVRRISRVISLNVCIQRVS